jgi:DNA-directed RNA polymerase III subunit RPC1
MVTETERLKYLKHYSVRSDPQHKQKIFKELVAECKKRRNCPHCEAFNGTVKKLPNMACRIIHAKFK